MCSFLIISCSTLSGGERVNKTGWHYLQMVGIGEEGKERETN